MSKYPPIVVGQRFGRYVAVQHIPPTKTERSKWECRCDCGTIRRVLTSNLLRGNSRSCGCLNQEDLAYYRTPNDLTGQRFGRYTVLRYIPGDYRGKSRWECQCDCGNIKLVFASNLRQGTSRSCGCLKNDELSRRQTIHGVTKNGANPPEYGIWKAMLRRCENPNDPAYKNYGGRGITVWPQWRASVIAFLTDMGPRPTPKHSLERRNNTQGYSPENCYWATREEQNNNTRRNRRVLYRDRILSVSQLAREVGVSKFALQKRIQRGQSVESAIAALLN